MDILLIIYGCLTSVEDFFFLFWDDLSLDLERNFELLELDEDDYDDDED